MRFVRPLIWIAIVVVIVIVVGMVVNAMSQKPASYNVAQIYITNWSNSESEPIDVQFKISMDLDDDGIFEVNRTSDIFHDTSFELAPFSLGGPIDDRKASFHFIIEVIEWTDDSMVIMQYTNDGISPVNDGSNEIGAVGSWSFSPSYTGDHWCGIEYAYYIS